MQSLTEVFKASNGCILQFEQGWSLSSEAGNQWASLAGGRRAGPREECGVGCRPPTAPRSALQPLAGRLLGPRARPTRSTSADGICIGSKSPAPFTGDSWRGGRAACCALPAPWLTLSLAAGRRHGAGVPGALRAGTGRGERRRRAQGTDAGPFPCPCLEGSLSGPPSAGIGEGGPACSALGISSHSCQLFPIGGVAVFAEKPETHGAARNSSRTWPGLRGAQQGGPGPW